MLSMHCHEFVMNFGLVLLELTSGELVACFKLRETVTAYADKQWEDVPYSCCEACSESIVSLIGMPSTQVGMYATFMILFSSGVLI